MACVGRVAEALSSFLALARCCVTADRVLCWCWPESEAREVSINIELPVQWYGSESYDLCQRERLIYAPSSLSLDVI